MKDQRDPRASIGRAENIGLSLYPKPRAYISEPLGIDLSAYQGVVDYDAPNWGSVEFVYMRGGISWGTKDTRFDFNWQEARKRRMRRGAYFVLYPGEDPARQVNFWLSLLDGDLGELPPALDVELYHNQTPARIAYAAEACLDLLSSAYGAPCVIYSAAWFVNAYMGAQDWFSKYWWWLATYLYANPLTGFAAEHPGPVTLPVGVSMERTLIHQTAGKYNATGFGVQSKVVDTDRWLKGLTHLSQFARPGLAPLTVEERLERLEERVDILEKIEVYID